MIIILKTILIDDERPALKVLEHLLKQYNEIQILGSFTNSEEALEMIYNNYIDLVFLDIDMPKTNGIEIAKRIISANLNTNIIFVTAYAHFALEAFEVNATDYIMKPVSKKRLDTTIERLSKKFSLSNSFSIDQERKEFFNYLISGEIIETKEIIQQGAFLDIDFTKDFSFFFLLIKFQDEHSNLQIHPISHVSIINIIDTLAAEPGLIPWETPQGISILNFTPFSSDDCIKEERAMACRLQKLITMHFPEVILFIGISERYSRMDQFAHRYIQARNTAVIGMNVYPDLGIYHFLNSGYFPVLTQYVNKQEVDIFITNTIGKILEHDKKNGTDLFHTMKEIIINNNLRSVAEKLFIHYKTVLFRKQSIEKIMGISMDSFEGRTMFGVALTFYYLREYKNLS
ncbi:response regulator [Pelosinus sp. sgz500959]|uniref:response regulator n=1 Tax=Pelosinus sp. sgz500959 TaxID=3242472 RepID=UPI00366C2652